MEKLVNFGCTFELLVCTKEDKPTSMQKDVMVECELRVVDLLHIGQRTCTLHVSWLLKL